MIPNKEEIKQEALRIYNDTKKFPIRNDWNVRKNNSICGSSTIQKLFGSYSSFKEECLLETNHNKSIKIINILPDTKVIYKSKNQNYKCPYCNITEYSKHSDKQGLFDSWKSVISHVSMCKFRTKQDYIICSYYGPISIEEVNTYNTIQDFKNSYPLTTLKLNSIFYELRRKNITNLSRTWDKKYCIKYIKDLAVRLQRTPILEDLIDGPSKGTFDKHFGSWNKALEYCELEINQVGFGFNTVAKDGKSYRSVKEAYFVDNYLFGKYNYEYEPKYGNGWVYDFYIKELGLYVEIDGELRPWRIQEKVLFCRQNNIKLVVIKSNDLAKTDKVLFLLRSFT